MVQELPVFAPIEVRIGGEDVRRPTGGGRTNELGEVKFMAPGYAAGQGYGPVTKAEALMLDAGAGFDDPGHLVRYS